MICSLNDKMGGAEQVLKMIASYYLREEYAVDVFFLTKSTGNLWDDVKDKMNLYYTKSEKESHGLFPLFKNIRQSNTKYQYAFTSHIYLNSFIGLLKKVGLINVQHLIGRDSHSYFLVDKGIKRYIYNTLINVGYSGLDLLVCQTEEMREQFIFNKKRLSSKILIRTIPNPIDMALIHKNQDENQNLEIGNDYIVSAGRLIKIKGFDTLIKSFHKLEYNDCNLVILGEGEERSNLQNLIDELGLTDKVLLAGFVNNVYPYFKNAKMCVVSSIKEGFPNTLLQMMSQNNKVVSTKCAGGIEGMKGIFTCNPDSVKELEAAMRKCLSSDTDDSRILFQEELHNRSIEKYVHTIKTYLCI